MNEKQVLKHTVSYDEGLLKALKDPEEARAYLEVALDECEASGEIDGLYWPCTMSPKHKGVLVHWQSALVSTANISTACFQVVVSRR